MTEFSGAVQLEKFRSSLANYKGLSFDTISSSGANGSIIHYKPKEESCATITADRIYLCDSGAQFCDGLYLLSSNTIKGTTDVTRTMHFGTPTLHERECFTRVLQGHIQIDCAVFPNGTTGFLFGNNI